jgi:cyd operon protein YbgE
MDSEAVKKGDAPPRIPYPDLGWVRAISILLAVLLSILFFTHSPSIAALSNETGPWILGLLMWACAIGFIHGVGFLPRKDIWRLLFSPFIGWPLMLIGITLILTQH